MARGMGSFRYFSFSLSFQITPTARPSFLARTISHLAQQTSTDDNSTRTANGQKHSMYASRLYAGRKLSPPDPGSALAGAIIESTQPL